jgi:hypothetical protein
LKTVGHKFEIYVKSVHSSHSLLCLSASIAIFSGKFIGDE